MTKRQVSFIYFDLGGVLFFDIMDQQRWENFASQIGIPQDKESDVDQIFLKYQDVLNRGKMSAETLRKIIEKEIGIKLKIKHSFQEAIISEFRPNPYISELINKLQPKYRLGLLTNMYPGMFEEITRRDLIPNYEWEVVVDSSKVGLAKPDPKIYEYAQQLVKVPPKNILFTDNTPVNVTTAEEMGWQTILYDPRNPIESNRRIEQYLELA